MSIEKNKALGSPFVQGFEEPIKEIGGTTTVKC